jgi:DNA polymerase III subunit epsilon
MDAAGSTLHEWHTLVNPGDGHAGATSIHGIKGDWLVAAPTFGDIAGDLVERVLGRVVVAHNTRFDLEFIEGEFRRLGLPVGTGPVPLDTMDLADAVGLPRRLQRLADELGLPYYPHGAMEDARTTARVLARLMPYINPQTFATDVRLHEGVFPRLPASGKVVHREQAAELTRPKSFLTDALADLAPLDPGKVHDPEAAAAYLTLLEQVMEDGYVSPDEQTKLVTTAKAWGLSSSEVDTLHREFLDGLLDAALADRSLSASERKEIERAAEWLGVEAGDLDLLVRQARARGRARIDDERAAMKGRTVVFTGRGIYSNSIREGLCAKYGIVFKTTVSDGCDLLVVGGEEVANATVVKARDLGMVIMVERGFWDRLGEKVPKTA